MGRLIGLTLAGFLAAAPAAAQDLCAAISIPLELGLVCTPATTSSPAAAVGPAGGEFAALSRMTLRELRRDGADSQAWSEPATWLRRQVAVDMTGFDQALSGLTQSPDSPLAGPGARGAAAAIESWLNQLGQLPLQACDEPVPLPRGQGTELRCRYTLAGAGLMLIERLVAVGERRFAIVMRTMNEQRLQHFEAIANSFSPS